MTVCVAPGYPRRTARLGADSQNDEGGCVELEMIR
jgi:hypothetical protein